MTTPASPAPAASPAPGGGMPAAPPAAGGSTPQPRPDESGGGALAEALRRAGFSEKRR